MQATVLIETLPAAFEMDEILWELLGFASWLSPCIGDGSLSVL